MKQIHTVRRVIMGPQKVWVNLGDLRKLVREADEMELPDNALLVGERGPVYDRLAVETVRE